MCDVTEPEETVTAPLFIFKVPAIAAPLLNVSAVLTFVVPPPAIFLARLPERLRVPEFVIAPFRLSAAEVKEPVDVTLIAFWVIVPVFVETPLRLRVPAPETVPALSRAVVVVPLFAYSAPLVIFKEP